MNALAVMARTLVSYRGCVYTVQENGRVVYEGTVIRDARAIYRRLVQARPKHPVLYMCNGVVAQRWEPKVTGRTLQRRSSIL